MNGRLDKLCFLPPPVGTPWSGTTAVGMRSALRRVDGVGVEFKLPLFWYDPPWHRISVSAADALAVAVGELGISVSALRSDLSGADQQPAFHDACSPSGDAPEGTDGEEQRDHDPLARMVPYRPERYGLGSNDFDDARVIDVRLSMKRDESGRFAFSPQQIERWETTPASQPLAGGGWVPAATFPPDVVSLQHLSSKLHQLRALSPSAAIFVSMGPYRLEDEIADIVKTRPDGFILRLDQLELDGLQLAAVAQRGRQLIDLQGLPALPLWVVPGEITPDDAAKLIALGACAVAIDSWCDPIIEEVERQQQQSTAPGGYATLSRTSDARLTEWVATELATKVERFEGLLNSMNDVPEEERLATLSDTWSEALGLKKLPLPLTES